MALAHAILAFLSHQACSGYDLAKQFGGSVGNFWKATHQQIYRELAKLEADRWIEAEIIQQSNRPDKKLYRVTETGKEQLIQWIGAPTEVAPVKDDILVKIYAGHLVDPTLLVTELRRHQHLHQEKLAVYRHLEETFFQSPETLTGPAKFSYLTLLRGIRYEIDCMGWCEDAIELLS